MKSVYGDYDSTFIANQRLRVIKQKRLGDIRGYILEFNRYADESLWNEEAKMDIFLAGLHDQIAIRILEMFPRPRSLTAMHTIASRINGRLSAHRNFSYQNNNRSNRDNSNNSNNKGWNFPKKNTKTKNRGPLTKEEKEKTFVYIAVHHNILLTIAQSKTKTSHRRALLILLTPNLKLLQDREFLNNLTSNSLFLNLLLM